MTLYDPIAQLYDAEHRDYDADFGLYTELARRTGGPVLEAMCGSGRVLVALAEAGFSVTGVDISAEMLAIAQQRVQAMKLTRRVQLIQADICNSLPQGPFALAIVALNSFMHLHETEQQLGALRHVRSALKDDGLLVLDVLNPNLQVILQANNQLVLDKTIELEDGGLVYKFVAQQSDPSLQLLHTTVLYDVVQANGELRRYSISTAMRWLYRFELEHLLARTGFVLEQMYGSYDLDEYSAESEQMIAVARIGDRGAGIR